MQLPLPQVIPDVGPGGRVVTNLNAINALANAQILKRINAIKEQYAPQLTQADINSKNAYAQLIGLQPLKALQNENVYPTLPDEIKNAIKERHLRAGGLPQQSYGQTNAFNQAPQSSGISHNPTTNSISRRFMDKLMHALNPNANTLPVQPMNSIAHPVPQNNSMELKVDTGNAGNKLSSDNINHDLDAKFIARMQTPEGIRALEEERARLEKQDQQQAQTDAEKIAAFEGIKSQGKEAGTIRAKDTQALDNQYEQALKTEVPINHLEEIVTNPLFINARKIPGFQKLQLDSLDVIGTPEEKELIGDFRTTINEALRQGVLGFSGRILDSEIKMTKDIKIQPHDSLNSIIGRIPSIKTFNQMTMQRARLASDIMQKEHISKGAALEKADKMVDGKVIREKVKKELDYPVLIRNNKTHIYETVPVSEARKRGVPNV